MTASICPCCLRPFEDGRGPVEALAGWPTIAGQPKMVLRALAEAWPGGVTASEITERLHHRSDGGPLWAKTIRSVVLHRLRRDLMPLGWAVAYEAGQNRCGAYRLVPLAEPLS